jgi:hypothetical protein
MAAEAAADPSAPSLCVLIARYREDVSWARDLPCPVVIYNKGRKLAQPQHILPNVGREGHTYFQFICDHYENLPEHLICLQGRPFDHSPDILADVARLAATPAEERPDFDSLCCRIWPCDLAFCATGTPFRGGIPLIPVYEKLFGERRERLPFRFGAGAQFIVSRRRILQRPRSFYKQIVRMLCRSSDPIEGYVIERFHGLIFSPRTRHYLPGEAAAEGEGDGNADPRCCHDLPHP